MMLIITLVAIVTGCILLNSDSEDYSSKPPPKETDLKIKALGDKAGLTDTGGAAPAPAPPPPGPPPPGPAPMGPAPMGPAPMGPMPPGP